MTSLWGDDFKIESTPQKAQKIIKKVEKAKSTKATTVRAVKSKTLSISDKIKVIKDEVHRILGRYIDNTQVITDIDELHRYIDTAINNGVIAVDTETNNTLQPVGCKIMGACIYTPGQKNAYIPINHIDVATGDRLAQQLTEQDLYNEFMRLNDTKIITHNGKFDYQVLKFTTGWKMDIYWDTLIGARILNENERAGLKTQYIQKIDPTVEKYSIDHLFEGVEYAQLPPELFALYAATDAYMTYKLYQYQLQEFTKPENSKLYSLFKNIEMPDVEVFAEMEYRGVELSLPYAERLSKKYGTMLSNIQKEIDAELSKYNDKIAAWRETPEANFHPSKTTPNGEVKYDKSLSEKLQDPINISSPTQLAILLYDILKVGVIDKKQPRGTGADILERINSPLCKLILNLRGLEKLISTYIEALPAAVNPADGRVHTNFNQLGAGTGRVSSDRPNLQNIPAHNKELRMLFKATQDKVELKEFYNTNTVEVESYKDVYTQDGWKNIKQLSVGDKVQLDDDNFYPVKDIINNNVYYTVVI